MEIRIKNDSVEISGYVNAIERKSKPLWSRMGQFVDHDPERDLGGTKDGNLELKEDNIGLHARATITDPEVVKKARDGDLVGWSFGFMDRDVDNKRDEDGVPLRDVKDMDLVEVSILDRTKVPAYDGTLVAVRSDETSLFLGETYEDEIQIRDVENEENKDETKQQETVEKVINYDEWDSLIADMKS